MVKENSLGLFLFILSVFLAINISSVIHKDKRIKVADKGSMAAIPEIMVNDEYWITVGVNLITRIANLMIIIFQ